MANFFGGYPQPQQYQQYQSYQQPNNNVIVVPVQGESGASTRRYYDGAEHDGYSGHSIQDRMIDQLERMMDEAKTEHERQTVRNWIARLQNK